MLKRKIEKVLLDWKNKTDRKPLIVKGARQIGKTESIRLFAKQNYAHVVEINFALQKKFRTIFDDGYEVESIIRNITFVDPSLQFVPGKTLIFFDELQDLPDCATSLKSFKMNGEYDVICSGSMMGINYKEIESNSVGYKEDFEMQSMDFEEFLWAKGYSDEQISRKIERYEDADMLYDEAVDAQARLQEISDRELEEQQRQQEEIREQQALQQRQFMTDLGNSINGLTAVRGIAIPKEDRKALYDYITRTDSDGLTQYQKDFQKNLVTNLVESAYFTMKGDALLGEAKRNGQTTAANKLRTMLRHQAKNHTRGGVEDEKPRSVADIASKWL